MKKIETNVLRLLMQGPTLLDDVAGVSGRAVRQLAAAKVKPTVKLRLRLEIIEDPGDGEDWDEHRKTLGIGQVMCPECEVNGTEPTACDLCKGVGMVQRRVWDEWYFTNKACRDFTAGCETTCTRTRCNHDSMRCGSYAFVLILEASGDGRRWKSAGNSLDGYRLAGLCSKPQALERFLNVIGDGINVLSFMDMDDEEE